MIIAFAVALAATQVLALKSLADLEWKSRVVLIFGKAVDGKVERQVGLLQSQTAELAERDMVAIRITGDEANVFYGEVSGLNASAIRQEANVNGGQFQVVLVGKDGGVKLRSDSVVRNVEIFDLIDSMPMRKSEQG